MRKNVNAFFGRTAKFLRGVFFSMPALITAGVIGAYVLAGFFLAPVVVKWQIEKQVQDKLAHRITLGKLRINPLRLTAEFNDVELRDAAGAALIDFERLFVDFEARSIIDRAWTFAAVTLERPAVHIESDKEGNLNFLPLIEALRGPAQKEEARLPRLVVQRLAVRGGRIEFMDHQLREPLVTRAAPVEIEFTDLSTLESAASPYHLSARTAAGETVRWSGVLRLNPLGLDGRLALDGLQTATLARALHEHFAIAAPAGRIDLAAEYRLAYAAGALSGEVKRVEIAAAGLSVSAPGGSSPLLALDTVALTGARADLGKREIVVPRLALGTGRLALRVDGQRKLDWEKLVAGRSRASEAKPAAEAKGGAAETSWNVVFDTVQVADVAFAVSDDAAGRGAEIAAVRASFSGKVVIGAGSARIALHHPQLALSGGALTAGDDRVALPATAFESAALSVLASGSRSEIRVERPKGSLAKVAIQYGANGVEVAAHSFEGEQLTVATAPGKLELGMDAPKLTVDGVVLRQGHDRIDVRNGTLEGRRLSMVDEGGALRIGGDGARLALSGLALKQGEDGVRAKSATLEGKKVTLVRAGAGTEPARVEASLQGAAASLAGLAVTTNNGNNELLHMGSARAGGESVTLVLPQAGAAVAGQGLSAELSAVVLRDPRTTEELARIGRAQLAGGAVRSGERFIAADSVLVADGGARVALDARGRFNWMRLAPEAAATSGAKGKSTAADASPWRVTAKTFALRNFGIAFTDARYEPAAAITLHAIQAKLDGIDTGAGTPASLDLRAKVREGGEIAVSGWLDPRNGRSDLNLKLVALDLAPVQPYLSEFARLALAAGTLSTEGRLRYGDDAAGAEVAYEGSAAVDKLLIEETDPRRPFLSWDSLAATGLRLTVSPNRLDIAELRVSGPAARLTIAEDQSANIFKVLRSPQQAGAPEKPSAHRRDEDPFPVSVERVRVERGIFEFADYSLRPQFGTRMHELKGVVTGFGTGAGSRAKLQLNARVDEYGLARIEGEINPLRPDASTDVDMTFRNLEMTALTPYVSKFAGYRIAAGKLSMDLRYRIKDGQLAGENHIVLSKLELGEKVDSPAAVDLPLELAIALLKDANGVIDVELPVRGNVHDPQFDYGEIIAKAIGNLIGGIVTAPFRALAALFGGGSEDLGTIEFEPGTAALTPPERHKLETVARALKNRPQLQLAVAPAFAADEDLAALKSVAVRREIATRMGIALEPGEEPGPLDVANPRAQRAVEALFAQRHSGTLLDALKHRQDEPVAGAVQGGKPAQAQRGALHRILLERLINEQPVGEGTLRELAEQRGAAIVKELTAVGGVETSRILLGEPQATTDASAKRVATRLELGAAR